MLIFPLTFDPLTAAKDVLSLFDGFINLAKQIKTHLTPQYEQASKALYLVTNFVYEDNQKILQWMVDFENLDFSKQETKVQFMAFKKKLEDFKISPEYRKFRAHCGDIGRIYDAYLDKPFQNWLGGDFAKAKKTFDKLKFADYSMGGLSQFIIDEVEKANVKINANFGNANLIQKEFIDKIKEHKQRMMNEADDLDKLRNDFFNFAGKPVSMDLPY